jgi:hypothetical protein
MAPAHPPVEIEPRPMPAEFQYLLIVAALFALLLIAGVPGRDLDSVGERHAGEPRREWAARWAAQVQAEQAAPEAPAGQPADAPPQR